MHIRKVGKKDRTTKGSKSSSETCCTDMLELDCNISNHFPPITIGSAFWCRTDALRKLFEYDWQYESFPEQIGDDGTISHALERIFGYVAQDAGYYTGVVYPTRLATLVLSNVSCMFRMVYYKAKRLCRMKGVRNINHLLTSLDKNRKKIEKMEKKLKKLNGRKAAVKHAMRTILNSNR